jgi:hypothetical protein
LRLTGSSNRRVLGIRLKRFAIRLKCVARSCYWLWFPFTVHPAICRGNCESVCPRLVSVAATRWRADSPASSRLSLVLSPPWWRSARLCAGARAPARGSPPRGPPNTGAPYLEVVHAYVHGHHVARSLLVHLGDRTVPLAELHRAQGEARDHQPRAAKSCVFHRISLTNLRPCRSARRRPRQRSGRS